MPAPSALTMRVLPEPISGLAEMALDLRWSTSGAVDHFWERLDPDLWEQTKNPYVVLQDATEAKLREVSADPAYVAQVEEAVRQRRQSLDAPTWFSHLPQSDDLRTIAYFSMEFGLSEALPIYAGGLGILAGDHLKTASSMGVPVIGIGLLYDQGYFEQMMTPDRWQIEAYPYNDPISLPVSPVLTADGDWLRISLDLPGRKIWIRVWQVCVGHVLLYLLDTNDKRNSPWDRAITAKLYAGDKETRLLQEVVLGIGGWEVLRSLLIHVDVCHMNEGHAAFVVIARALSFALDNHVDFETGLWATRAGNVFTTHTPVPAGFDVFESSLVRRYLQPVADASQTDVGRLLSLGSVDQSDTNARFNMAYCAARGSVFVNGVSKLHGEVSRELFAGLYPRWPLGEIPVFHVTNGVHTPSWDTVITDKLWQKGGSQSSVPDFVTTVSVEPDVHSVPLSHDQVSDRELMEFRSANRLRLVKYVRRRIRRQYEMSGSPNSILERVSQVLDPDILTLGFARRFAAYKRPNLLLTDIGRLARLLRDPNRPVQLIVAGKAHPGDEDGKRLVQAMAQAADIPEICDRLVFMADYDIALTQYLAGGVDVWLNTPRRPMEASGTSGMKVLVNGGLNLSELDGWWPEAYTPDVGWALGDGQEHSEPDWDRHEAEQLYSLLESEIAPIFYDRDADGIPREWLRRVRASMTQLTPRFSSQRMVREYTELCYIPAAKAHHERSAASGSTTVDLQAWAERVTHGWSGASIASYEITEAVGVYSARVMVRLGDLSAKDVAVELYADAIEGHAVDRVALSWVDDRPGGSVFAGTLPAIRPESHYTPRIVPAHPAAFIPQEIGCITWPG